MKKKHIFYLVAIVLTAVISSPFIFLSKTYLKEDNINRRIPQGFTNYASQLSLTKIDSIFDAPTSKTESINQLKYVFEYAKNKNIPISIAGAKHSMGGHTMYPNGVVLNMRPYNQMELDTVSNILTIGSGALWEEAIEYLNGYGKSISVMQAFSSFSIGGSISVNGHGWQKDAPPVSSSVVSFTLMKANGEIVTCSRTENAELFSLVVGGYGLFGIILDVKLKVVDNENMTFKRYEIKSSEYLDYFEKYASQNENVQLVFGRLNISEKDFLENATLNVFISSKVPVSRKTQEQSIKQNEKMLELKRVVFRSSVDSEYGKRLRWELETNVGEFSPDELFTRNELLNDNVSLIENKDTTSTDILHEYFIPKRNFHSYIEKLKTVLPDSRIDLLNITIRNVYPDKDSYMSYANEEVFGYVFLFNQKTKCNCTEKVMEDLTKKLVDVAIEMEGTYYLPYRLHIDKERMRKVYPQSDEFFKLKLKYDSAEVFKNKFYEHYK